MSRLKLSLVVIFHEYSEFDQLLDQKCKSTFFRLQIHTSISIPHLLSFLTKRLNNGESCKGQKRMSSSGNTKKSSEAREKENVGSL